MCSSLRVYDFIKWVWLNSSLTCDWTRKCSRSVLCTRVVFIQPCVCVSEMCVEDLQSWGWTDLCVPPPDVFDCIDVGFLSTTFLFQYYMNVISLICLDLRLRPNIYGCFLLSIYTRRLLQTAAARFGLSGLGLKLLTSCRCSPASIKACFLPLYSVFSLVALTTPPPCPSQSGRSGQCPDAAWGWTMACWTVVCPRVAPPSVWEDPAGGAPGD